VARSGRTTHKPWKVTPPARIHDGELIDRDPNQDGSEIVVLSFQDDRSHEMPSRLAYFDLASDPPREILSDAMTEYDLPPTLKESSYTVEDFYPNLIWSMNVFDDVPGREIVVTWWHNKSSPAAIRVHDQQGRLLWQFWHLGTVGSCFYLEGPGLLVFTALNAQFRLQDLGYTEAEADHARVVFAIRPQVDLIDRALLHEDASMVANDVAWYRYVHPPTEASRLHWHELTAPRGQFNSAEYVSCELRVPNDPRNASISFVLDAAGQIVPEGVSVTDAYVANGPLDPEELFLLDKLSPVDFDAGSSSNEEPSRGQ
jgi:hypothetical protein